MPDWLDSWTKTRRLTQQDLARMSAERTAEVSTDDNDLRKLREDERLPKEYRDRAAQEAFEAAYRKHRHLLRLPAWL